MAVTQTQEIDADLLGALMSDDTFTPTEPHTLEETGLTETCVESLVCKFLLMSGTSTGRRVTEFLCLPFAVIDRMLGTLRTRQIVVHAGSAAFNDFYYTLTELGRNHAQAYQQANSYCGPAPVPLMDYIISVEAQAISAEPVRRDRLESALRDISVPAETFEILGPAVNSAAGMFLHGAPGNGKSTLAKRITMCFGQAIWVPHAIIEDAQLVKVFDAAYHHPVKGKLGNVLKSRDYDRRWVKIRRPTVVVGGELTLDNLEIRHDPRSNVCEAPLQMKSNCGCLLIDDFGRQRIAPAELLNRWIIPLESRHDFLTLPTGKKIQVPFEQLIIFSTNLEPRDLVDEAFMRRIPYKIEISDPKQDEFYHLFELYANEFGCEYRADAVDHLLKKYYMPHKRALRRCHPRDLLKQLRNYCTFHSQGMEMRPELFDRIARSFFTSGLGMHE